MRPATMRHLDGLHTLAKVPARKHPDHDDTCRVCTAVAEVAAESTEAFIRALARKYPFPLGVLLMQAIEAEFGTGEAQP